MADGTLAVSGTLSSDNLTVKDGGYADISGTATIAGVTTVGSNLHLDGTLNTGSLAMEVGGMLWGNGTINGDMVSYGGIAPGNSMGTLSVGGGLTLNQCATYYAEIDAEGNSDLISTSGTVSLDSCTMETYLPVALYTDRFSWTLISADGGITGNFHNVNGQPDSETLSLHSVNYGDELKLEVWRKSFSEFASTSGGGSAGLALDALVGQALENDDTMASLLLAMDWSYGSDDIRAAVEAMSAEMYTAFTTAGLNSAALFNQAYSERLSELRRSRQLAYSSEAKADQMVLAQAGSGLENLGNPGGTDGRWGVWARLLAAKGDWSGSDGCLGFEQTVTGAAGGADVSLTDWLRLGFAAGLTQGDIDWNGRNYSGDQNGLHLGFYGQAAMKGWFINASGSYASFDNDAERGLAFGVIDARARAGFDSSAWLGRIEAGHDLALGSWLLSPAAALRYISLKEDSFSESGADFLSLNGEERTSESLASTLGIRLATLWKLGQSSRLIPRVGVFWLHEFNDDAPMVTTSFRDYASNPFDTTGQAPATDRVLTEAGLELKLTDFFSATFDYTLDWGRDSNVQSIRAGIKLAF